MNRAVEDPFSGVEAFVAAAEERSFREGAARLGVTPAAVSKAVGRLEEAVGVRLLDRTTRRVRITAEGEIYLGHCRKALLEMRLGRMRVEQAREVAEGQLVVALSTVLGPSLVSKLGKFMTLCPGLTVRLQFGDKESKLVDEQIDVALRIGKLTDSSDIALKIRDLTWATVASPAYLKERGTPQNVQDLCAHDCLGYRSSKGVEVEWAFLTHPRGSEVQIWSTEKKLLLDDGRLLVEAALAGLGVAQVFGYMVEERLESGQLLEVLSDWAAPGPALHALCKPGSRHLPKVRAFLDFVRAEYQ